MWTDHKTNTDIAKELNIVPGLDKMQDYKRNWIQHVNGISGSRSPRLIKKIIPQRGEGRQVEILLDA